MATEDLTAVDGVGEEKADDLREAGYESVADLVATNADRLGRGDGPVNRVV